MILVMVTLLLCAVIILAAAGVAPSSVITQQEEETSLGEEEEDDADSIVSYVLDGQNAVNQDNTAEQDAANTNLDSDFQQGFAQEADDDGNINIDGPEPECALEISADKEIYGPGDMVVIIVTNIDDDSLDFPNSALGLQIKNVDTGEVFPLVAAQVVTTLEPGESRTFEFTYEELVSEIGTGLISATVVSECGGGGVVAEEVAFRLSMALPEGEFHGKIAFSSLRDGNEEIYVMNADGTGQTRLTDSPGSIDYWPRWSPDGTKIVFTSDRDGNREIYVMNADGSNPTRLTNNPATDASQNWSPDGTKIVFTSDRDGNREIYVMNADGSNPTRLTNNGQIHGPSDQHPDWSPDGTKIAFSSQRDANSEIYVMNADGSNPTRLTNNDANDEVPSWSPDGTKITFSRYTIDVLYDIYVMNADGTEQTRLTNDPSGDADGTEQTRLTNDPSGDRYPDWGPATDTDPRYHS